MAESSKRIKAIELRWGKDFMEVLADLHDHVFGKSPDVPAEDPPAPPEPPAPPPGGPQEIVGGKVRRGGGGSG